ADVALLFRPVNYPVRGLVARISEVPCIAYLGDNVYSACGGFDLWAHLLTRPLWVHATQPEGPHRSLLIYGPSTGEVRAPACAEEKAAVRNEMDRVRVARELVQRFTGIPVSDR
ncbi:hypothetical protein EBT31_06475, partial [bacterium]|nr:hypothetical protein [bacterium]